MRILDKYRDWNGSRWLLAVGWCRAWWPSSGPGCKLCICCCTEVRRSLSLHCLEPAVDPADLCRQAQHNLHPPMKDSLQSSPSSLPLPPPLFLSPSDSSISILLVCQSMLYSILSFCTVQYLHHPTVHLQN